MKNLKKVSRDQLKSINGGSGFINLPCGGGCCPPPGVRKCPGLICPAVICPKYD